MRKHGFNVNFNSNCIFCFACSSFIELVYNIPFCSHVVSKKILVPCSFNLTCERDNAGHGEATINNARIIHVHIL